MKNSEILTQMALYLEHNYDPVISIDRHFFNHNIFGADGSFHQRATLYKWAMHHEAMKRHDLNWLKELIDECKSKGD